MAVEYNVQVAECASEASGPSVHDGQAYTEVPGQHVNRVGTQSSDFSSPYLAVQIYVPFAECASAASGPWLELIIRRVVDGPAPAAQHSTLY